MKNLETTLDWALHYQSLGLTVIPAGKDKVSLIKWKPYQNRISTVEEIKQWWTQWPDANIAIVTGKNAGIVALDLDKKHNRSSKEFEIPKTACAKSGGGGEHFFLKHPGIYVKSDDAISGLGVDSKGDGGYIILAPSVNESGGKYEWIVPFTSKDELAEMPDWFKKLTTGDNGKQKNKVKKNEKEKKWLKGKDGVLEGERNGTAASMAGKILSTTAPELWESLGWEQLQIWNTKNPEPITETELRTTWESIKKYHENGEEENLNPTQADILLEKIFEHNEIFLFHDGESSGYASLTIGGHQETWPCKGKRIKLWIASEAHRIQKKVPTAEIKKNLLAVLEGRAVILGPEIELQNRVAWHEDKLWYDLANKEWQAIQINKDGWNVIDKPPVIFKRYSHNKVQVIPARNGDAGLFLNYVNVKNPEHQLLLMVFLVSCFIPGFPHVMSVIFGPQGASKSTLARFIRMVIDPSRIDLASFPNSSKELIQVLAHNHFLFFDNVSYISEDQSDTLCKAITGGGHFKRELYENDEDIIYNFMRCIGINGINFITTRPDLLERSLLLELERVNPAERKTEKELYENFGKDLPSILGGILDVLVKTINIQPTIKIDSPPRMADWALWGCAIAEALGYGKDAFLSAYENNITHQTEMLLNENIVATALFSFMEVRDYWKSTPTELLRRLSTQANFGGIDTREKYWPKGSQALSRRLNELSTPLKKMGYSVVINTTGTERFIEIQKMAKDILPEINSKDVTVDPAPADATDDIPESL